MCGSIVRLSGGGNGDDFAGIRSGKRGGIGAGFRPRLQPRTAAKRKRLCSSERDHSEAGDGPEVFHVDRDDIEAQMQGRSADEQVL